MLFVEVKTLGSSVETVDREFAPTASATTLRGLLEGLVTAEVDAYEERRERRRILHLLTDRQLAAGQATGRFGSGGRDVPPAPPADVAFDRAIEAFRDGLFLAVLDGRQLDELDAPITVGPAARLRLIRVVALAGG